MPRKRHGTDQIQTDRKHGKPKDTIGARVPATHTFLIRLWEEGREDPAREPIWRGTISNLRGRRLGTFSSAAELMGILNDMSGVIVLLRPDRGDGDAMR